MSMKKRKEHVFSSIREFEKEYLPESYKKSNVKNPVDAQALGVSLAKESLDKIRKELV